MGVALEAGAAVGAAGHTRFGAGTHFIGTTPAVHIGLAVLNLLPIPVLDGGHLTFYLLEAIRGKPLTLRVQDYATRIGMAALLMLMVYALSNDIRNIFIS